MRCRKGNGENLVNVCDIVGLVGIGVAVDDFLVYATGAVADKYLVGVNFVSFFSLGVEEIVVCGFANFYVKVAVYGEFNACNVFSDQGAGLVLFEGFCVIAL